MAEGAFVSFARRAGRAGIPLILAGIMLSGLAGCQITPPKHGVAPELPPLPPLATAGTTHYRIDPSRSDIRFLVYRAGELARLGHNHVIRADDVTGDVYLNPAFDRSGFEISLPVKAFRVDKPALRKSEGSDFDTKPSDEAITRTIATMFGPSILDAEQHPVIHVRSVKISGPEWGPDVTLRIRLRGVEQEVTVPVALEECAGVLIATGSFEILQSDFGITPLSILGGGLQVRDGLRVRFRIVAVRP